MGEVVRRPDWTTYFLGIAEAVSVRGDCTRRKVGAVIADRDHRLVGAGYNGTAPGVRGCLDGGCPRGQHYRAFAGHSDEHGVIDYCGCGRPHPCPDYVLAGSPYDETGLGRCMALHAELNACIDSGRRAASGGTIYISCEPCFGCIKVIQAAGIRQAVYAQDGKPQVLDWPFVTI